jgi:DNA-binding NtrC family response regulator
MSRSQENVRVLIVEDDRTRAGLLTRTLSPEYDCTVTHDFDAGLRALGEGSWRVALADYSLEPGDSGLEFLQSVRDLSPTTVRILYTVHYCSGLVHDARRFAEVHQVLDARPVDFLTHVRDVIDNSLAQIDTNGGEVVSVPGLDTGWIAKSDESRAFVRQLHDVAQSARPVFLWGGPGCGKTFAGGLVRQWRNEWRQRRSDHAGAALNENTELLPPAILHVPSLDKRRSDVRDLVMAALHSFRPSDSDQWRLGPGVLDELLNRSWEGNVRQLRAVITRACHRSGERRVINVGDLPNDRALIRPAPSQYAKDDGQRLALLRQLRMAGSVAKAAELESISRGNYIRLMRRLGIERVDVANTPPPPRLEVE